MLQPVFETFAFAPGFEFSVGEDAEPSFLSSNKIARFACTADRDSKFEPTLFFKLCDSLDFERIRTTAYQPAANAMVKCLHPQLKAALMSHADLEHRVDNLQITLPDIRSTLCKTRQRSSTWRLLLVVGPNSKK